MRKVLVTGANGFVGSHLVEALLKDKFQVICLVRKTSNIRWLSKLDNITLLYGDITQEYELNEILKNSIDVVFHIAGLKYDKNKEKFFDVNVKGTENLVKVCEKHNIKKFIYLSSLAVIGPSHNNEVLNEDSVCSPITIYGRTKLKGEEAVKNSSIEWVILRPTVIYGPRDYDMLAFFKNISRRIEIFIKKKVGMVYVTDVVRAMLLVVNKNVKKETYVISENVYSWKKIQDCIAESLKVKPVKVCIPDILIKVAGYSFEKVSAIFGKSTPINTEKANEAVNNWFCSGEKITRELGFNYEWNLEKGINDTIRWYKNNKLL